MWKVGRPMPAPDPTRLEIGYWLSSEEHAARALVRNAVRAEEAGFSSAMISDHYHPWTDRQGESPFVWSVLGAIAGATEHLRVGTGGTAPIMRIHPSGRRAGHDRDADARALFLGVGSGERLNEHVVGSDWPPADVRLAMLEEAVDVIRALWRGEIYSHRGRYFTVDNARLHSHPEVAPPIFIATGSPGGAQAAGRFGDGLVGVTAGAHLVEAFEAGGGSASRGWRRFTSAGREPRPKRVASHIKLGLSVANAKARVHRARSFLRQRLAASLTTSRESAHESNAARVGGGDWRTHVP